MISEETRRKMSDAKKGKPSNWKGKHPSTESRQKMSDARKGRFAGENHPMYGKHHSKASCEKISNSLKETDKHPWRGKQLPDAAKAGAFAYWTPERRAAESKQMSGSNNPMFGLPKERSPNYGKPCSEETRRKIGDCQRGPNSHSWKGGISFEPYCEKFNTALKAKVRKAFNYTCVKCGNKKYKPGLPCHHINFDKLAGCFGKPWNLITMCERCHGWSTVKRHDAFNLLISWWLLLPDITLNRFPFCELVIDANYNGLKF